MFYTFTPLDWFISNEGTFQYVTYWLGLNPVCIPEEACTVFSLSQTFGKTWKLLVFIKFEHMWGFPSDNVYVFAVKM